MLFSLQVNGDHGGLWSPSNYSKYKSSTSVKQTSNSTRQKAMQISFFSSQTDRLENQLSFINCSTVFNIDKKKIEEDICKHQISILEWFHF